MAKTFFYVCAGLLCLAGTYHVGATTATARISGQIVAGSFDPDTDPIGVDAAGNAWMLDKGGLGCAGPVQLPGSGDVIEMTADVISPGVFEASLLYANGDAFRFDRTSWIYVGNVFCAPTSTERTSMGRLKDQYRR